MKLMQTLFTAVTLFTATCAHASLETWRLTATINSQSPISFVPPSFATNGSSITIDYQIDTSIQLNSGFYGNAIKSVTFNGETSQTSGYILAWEGLTAINASLSNRQNDQTDFISLNFFTQTVQPTVALSLSAIAAGIQSGNSTQLRLDFGTNSVWANPTSFSAVPVPATAWLFGSGFLGLMGIARRKVA